MDDFTRKFSLAMEKDEEIHQILSTVYQALEENNARTLIRKIDRDELLQVLVRKYLGQ